MSAPLPELLAPGAAVAPAAGRTRARGAWARGLRLWLPAGFLILMLGACFIWPIIYPVPDPVRGSVLQAGLPPLSPGTSSAPTRSATTCSPASCTAARSRSRSGLP